MEAAKVQVHSRWDFAHLRRITTSSHRYMAEVDGLRFIAIFSVMLFHVYYKVAHSPDYVLSSSSLDFIIWPVTHGFRGVQLFFVISGFILGLPFAAHYLASGPAIKVGRFYLRRLTRLEPPYILTLLFFYAAAFLTHNYHTREPGYYAGLPLRLLYGYLFVYGVPPVPDGPTWSLEIEVQFYLLAPLLAKVFKLPAMPRRLTLISAICAAPLLAHIVPRGESTLLGYAQYFLMGFLLADIHCTAAGEGRWPAQMFDLLAIGCILVMLLVPETKALLVFLPWVNAGIFISALRGRWFTRILRRPMVSIVGGMCYSLYLWHDPLLSFVTTKVIANGMSLPQAYLRLLLLGMPVAIGAGVVFYMVVERPCMVPNWPHIVFQWVSRKLGYSQST
jgi:peptidoglycan/LPS O-acetylase OafA/YrhL